MGKTIIQSIGPLYGDVVNGTVFGRPNGSIYVPLTNRIEIKGTQVQTIANAGGDPHYLGVGSIGSWGWVNFVAESQDVANYMAIEYSTASDFATFVSAIQSAGLFNVTDYPVAKDTDSVIGAIVNGQTYYMRAVLYAASGVAVAVSDTVELTGVAE